MIFKKVIVVCLCVCAQLVLAKNLILKIDGEINFETAQILKLAIEKGEKDGFENLYIRLNTFGGQVEYADQMRQSLLKTKLKTTVIVDKNAASAGALVSLACDSIWMTKGASMGAATVVNGQNGKEMPEKYQSYMRSLFRSTAEAKNRNADIAEQFVNGFDSAGNKKVLSLTAQEALEKMMCDKVIDRYESIFEKVVSFEEFELSFFSQIVLFLNKPIVSTLLILLVVGGLWLEFQSPGIGLPLVTALTAGMLYVLSHYSSGLLTHWELGLFGLGFSLLALEILVIPGFGLAGILGILFLLGGLFLAMLPNDGFDFTQVPDDMISSTLLLFSIVLVASVFLIVVVTKRIISSKQFKKISLDGEALKPMDNRNRLLIGKFGIASTDLKPSGKVEIEGRVYDAIVSVGLIERGNEVEVVDVEFNQLVVKIKS